MKYQEDKKAKLSLFVSKEMKWNTYIVLAIYK